MLKTPAWISSATLRSTGAVLSAPLPDSCKPDRHAFSPLPTSSCPLPFRHADFSGIVLNSSLIQHPESAPEEAGQQESWLLAQLEKIKSEGARHVAVFQHIPFFPERPDQPDRYFNIPLEARKKYLDMLVKYGVHDVFAGHYHRNASGLTNLCELLPPAP